MFAAAALRSAWPALKGGVVLIDLLLGNAVGLQQKVPAVCRSFRQIQVGLRPEVARHRPERVPGRLRGCRSTEQITCFHFSADIEVPFSQVAVGARVNGGFYEGLNVSRQVEILCRTGTERVNH